MRWRFGRHVGHDLPGAVKVLPDDAGAAAVQEAEWESERGQVDNASQPWRFSLAGVGLNLSLLERDDRLTLPASGEGGDWIVKFPSPEFKNVPVNENGCPVPLAGLSGIDVPDHRLVHRDELPDVPEAAWRGGERVAFAARRFDRDGLRKPVHIEDFAQLRGYRSARKDLTYETIGALCYRGWDQAALRQFVRRLTFNILLSNGDGHLKNWSLIYHNPQKPTLSPAYDLVSTAMYARARGFEPDLGLTFGGSKRYIDIRLSDFRGLARKLSVDSGDLSSAAEETIEAVLAG